MYGWRGGTSCCDGGGRGCVFRELRHGSSESHGGRCMTNYSPNSLEKVSPGLESYTEEQEMVRCTKDQRSLWTWITRSDLGQAQIRSSAYQ